MPVTCPTPTSSTGLLTGSVAPAPGPMVRPSVAAPTLVARAQRRAVTAALHRGPVVGLDHDAATGTYRLVVTLR